MNILMLTSVYPQEDDKKYKTTPTVQYFCREWVKQGHKVFVIDNGSRFPSVVYHLPKCIKKLLENRLQLQIPSLDSWKNIDVDDQGVKVYRRNMLKYIPHSPYTKKSIEQQCRLILSIISSQGFEPNLIIGHWANPQAALLSWFKKYYQGKKKTAIVFHNDCEKLDVERYSLKEHIKDIDVVGCRNKKYAEMVKQNLKLNYTPFICYSGIPNETVNNTCIEDLFEKKREGTILYVGRLVKYKKVETIIAAFANVRMSNIRNFSLKLVGEGSEKENIVSLISKKGLTDVVCQIDRLPRTDVFKEMEKSECFAMISDNEVFGMVYLEAMLMGCITIATRGCAVDGIIIDGVNGFLCEAGNEKELSAIFMKIAKMTKVEKQTMMRKAHDAACLFSDQNVAKRYLEDVTSYVCGGSSK